MESHAVSCRTRHRWAKGVGAPAAVLAAVCGVASSAMAFGIGDITKAVKESRKVMEEARAKAEEAERAILQLDQIADSVQTVLEVIAPPDDSLAIDTLAVFGLTDSIAPMDSSWLGGLDDPDSLEFEGEAEDEDEDESIEDDEDIEEEDEPAEDE